MKKCIICNKLIEGALIVTFDDKHSAHLDCWTDKIPDATGAYSSATEKQTRKDKVQEIAKKLISDYKNQNK